ncbi:MAG: HEAT repeat domain-containing protein [Planctomycetota bacterium]
MILQCIALQQKIRQARWVVCLFACICCSLAPAQKQADLEALVADFHEVRNEFDRAARNDAEIPLELTRRVQEVTNAIGREGPAGQNFLFGRLTLDTGAMQGHLVEGLLASHEPRVSQRIYKQAQLTERRQAPLGREAFQTFFELVPTNHLTIQFADLGRFVNSNPSWRRNGVMSYLARVQTLESIHYLLECPLVDKRDGEYSENAVFATLGHFRSLLQELEDPKAVAAVATALTGKPRYFAKGASAFDPKTQTEATLALGELGYIDVAPVMARNLGHKHLELAVASARALGSLRVAAAYEPLEKALGARKSAEFSLVALYALSRIDAVRTKPLLLAHAKSKDWRIRSVVVQGLGLAQDPATDALLLEFLTDASWQVRKSAFEALAARPTREFIGALIASLAQQRGALRSRIYKALTIWTERNLGPDPKAWEDFWKAEGEKFSLVDRPVPVGRTYVDHGDPSLPRYFGMEIHSQDVAFVIDRSGSMRLRYLAPGEDGGSKSMQGLQMVKKELWKTLEKLKEAQRFNIVAFGTSFKPLFRQPKKASGRGKRAAAGFLDKLYAEGGTNIF